MEDYGFEYSEEEPEEQDVDIENQYYNSKGEVLGGRGNSSVPEFLSAEYDFTLTGCSTLRNKKCLQTECVPSVLLDSV